MKDDVAAALVARRLRKSQMMTPIAATRSTPKAIPTPSPAFAGVERPLSDEVVGPVEPVCVASAALGVDGGGVEDVVEVTVVAEVLDDEVDRESTTSPVAFRKTPCPFSQQFASLSQHQL